MENKYSDFKKINPFRRSSRVGYKSSRANNRKTNFPERLDSETKPKLFSPPEVVDKEFKTERFESNDSDVESSEEGEFSSFIDEFSSMLDGPSQSYSGSMNNIEKSLWQQQEQDQDEKKEKQAQQTEEESTSTRSNHDGWRNKKNPFINEFIAMLEEYSANGLEEDYSSFEEESVEDSQKQENLAAHTQTQEEGLEQGCPFVNEFTAMLDGDHSIQQVEEEADEDLGEVAIDGSDDEGEEDTTTRSESFEEDELEEEGSLQIDFTSMLEEDSAYEQGEEYSDEVIDEDDRNHAYNHSFNDEIQEENPFKEEFTSMLEDSSSGELGDDRFTSGDSEGKYLELENEVEQLKQQIEMNIEENEADESSEDFHQDDEDDLFGIRDDDFYEDFEEDSDNDFKNLNDDEELDHAESLQQEMLSILEETDEENDTSLQFMEDIIEYFDEIEDNRSFPLDRFLEFLINVYCPEEADHQTDIDDGEFVEEEDDKEINDHPSEDSCLEDPSVIVKLPVTLANVNVEIDILKEIDLHTPISSIKNITWSISSLKSNVLLPSSTVFFKGVLVVEVEFEGQDTNSSIQSIKFPIEWEESVDVTWLIDPELSEEYEEEYTFDGSSRSISRSMHLESYQKLAHEVEHDLKDVQCLWHYDVDRDNKPKRLQLNGAVTLLIDLSQDQYLPI